MNNNINWKEVETKISIICNKFNNLDFCREDLAQELRIHAYYVSDDYYDLCRKAIDFWRKIQSRQSPEVPYVDLEIASSSDNVDKGFAQFDELVRLIKEELDRPEQNAWDKKLSDLARQLLDIMISDIDPRKKSKYNKDSKLNPYINKRLNISWASEEVGAGYKRVMMAMKFLEDIVSGLSMMHKIEIPEEYLKDYYKD